MNDQELAIRLVTLKIVKLTEIHHTFYFDEGESLGRSDHKLVRDWRVAGAVMELAIQNKLMQVERWDESLDWAVDFGGGACSDHGSLPRAIIEACVKLLEGV